MSTVSNGPEPDRFRVSDPLRRRVDFADVFAPASVREDVSAVVRMAERGLVDVGWIRELFDGPSRDLVAGVRAFDRSALRAAHILLFVEEPAINAAVRHALGVVGSDPVRVRVADAVAEVVGAMTRVDDLAAAWVWFVHGDLSAQQ